MPGSTQAAAVSSYKTNPPPPAFVPWVLWFSIFWGLVIITFFVGGGISFAENPTDPPAWMLIVPSAAAFLSLVIRFAVIPRLPEKIESRLPLMLVGLALAEGAGILALFLIGKPYPRTQLVFLAISALCILFQAPVYFLPKKSDGYQH